MKSSKGKKPIKASNGFCSNCCLLICISILSLTVWYYYYNVDTSDINDSSTTYSYSDITSSSNSKNISNGFNVNFNNIDINFNSNSNEELSRLSLLCMDPIWCNVPMPKRSHYYFDPPSCPLKWKRAQIQAGITI